MRIGLNLLHVTPAIGGVWNYVANLVAALGKFDGGHRYVVFVTKESRCLVPKSSSFEPVVININPFSRPQRVVYENSILQLLSAKYRLDAMHWFANTHALFNAAPSLVTVYDLQPFLNLYKFKLTKRLYQHLMISYSARYARMLLPISETTEKELKKILHVDPKRMTCIPPCIDSEFKESSETKSDSFKIKYNLPVQFWLYVANYCPHKNHIRLLTAYQQMKSQGFAPWPLVFRGDPAGAEEDIIKAIEKYSLSKDVLFLPRLTTEELPVLFSAATALVFPSFYEGGGIPVIEAMACGLPVIASDIPAVREFAADAIRYFKPMETDSIFKAMHFLQNDSNQRENGRRAGLARAEMFSMHNIASKLHIAYSSIGR